MIQAEILHFDIRFDYLGAVIFCEEKHAEIKCEIDAMHKNVKRCAYFRAVLLFVDVPC